ncbi:LLM class flavin-dependent oxidoreductase [Actinomadura algeriensis]|uniref:F420-dependent oxidoreductase n=1 Tax=Actinomadura algeriensis TaxID=1679523 RepID=A0ABR9K203_9ACTN|nr:LLM class flavin-dependent oxidoreductase [Actinomadura algeriensis]MBE1536858.1 putative F420-dependent oxidoreductase [Actinomadura algeriensis]
MNAREMFRGPVSFGCVAPPDAAGVRAAEELGADSLWVGGHIASVNPSPEPMAWLARLVEQSRRAVLGTAVVPLPLYPPALIAKQAADLDRAAGGRLALGIGVGGEYAQEFSACQVPPQERGARVDEALPLIRRLWTGEPVTHAGAHYPMSGVVVHPAPAQSPGPPIIVAGRGRAAMRRAATLGDGWMPYMYSPRRYRESVGEITRTAREAGRDLSGFAWALYLPVSVHADGRRARRDAAAFLGGTYRQDFDGLVGAVTASGTPGEVAARVRAYMEAGARHFVFLDCRRDVDGLAPLFTHVVADVRDR